MKSLKLALLATLFFVKSSFCQKAELINSGDLINKSVALTDSGDFKGAIKLLNKISRSDTNYVNALYKKVLAFEADSQYNDAIKYCQEALLIKGDHQLEPEIYNTYGNVLNDMERYEDAIKIFDTAIVKFPAYSYLYFNKGLAYLRSNRPEQAEEWFKKTLLINPYLYTAHYNLAVAATLQGKIIPGYISYFSYLLFAPNGKYAANSINVLQQISVGTDEMLGYKNNRKIAPNANYQAVEDVLFSKIALSKSYKPLTGIDDPISRQIQAVMEKVEYNSEDSDFWAQYYVPYLKKVYADNKFDLFIHHLFSSVNIPEIKTYHEKNKKQLDAFAAEAGVYFDAIRSTQELFATRRDTVARQYIYEDGALIGKGKLNKTGKSLIGFWEGLYEGGNKKSQGMYDPASQRVGQWVWYTARGIVKSKENYVNGKLEGRQEYNFSNGNASSVESYVNGQLQGLTTLYYYGGSVKSIANYKLGKLNGEEKAYFISGDLQSVNNYTAGALNGTAKEYFRNGKLKSVFQQVNGKAEGPYKLYNDRGILTVEGNFVKDAMEGEWKYYYDNGKIKQIIHMLGGVGNGKSEEYFENGKLSGTYSSIKGKVTGEALDYYKDGTLLSRRIFTDGNLSDATYFSKSGKALSTLVKVGDSQRITSYNIDGFKNSSMTYKSGLLNGPDTVYFTSGQIDQISNYANGEVTGKLINYFQNGKVKSEITMLKGKSDGYYISYYMNGNTESEGWMRDDQNEGQWFFYNENGKLSTTQNYLNGEIDGYKEEYLASGQKSADYKFYRGWLEEVVQYNESGTVIGSSAFPQGKGIFKLRYPDGKTMVEANYKNGELDGIFKSYYFDGSPEKVFFYNFGEVDSTFVQYHYGGKKSQEGAYALGNRTGKWNSYDEDGKLSVSADYNHNMLDGERISYYPDGSKDFVANYKDDLLEGAAKKYEPNGSLAYQIVYDGDRVISYSFNDANGKAKDDIAIDGTDGVLKAYFSNGKVSRETSYKGGIRHGADHFYYENGSIMSVENLEYNILQGSSKSYYDNGALKTDFVYLNDNLHGLCKEYHKNGKIKKETTYEHGVQHGETKTYDENGKLRTTMLYDQGTLKSVKNV